LPITWWLGLWGALVTGALGLLWVCFEIVWGLFGLLWVCAGHVLGLLGSFGIVLGMFRDCLGAWGLWSCFGRVSTLFGHRLGVVWELLWHYMGDAVINLVTGPLQLLWLCVWDCVGVIWAVLGMFLGAVGVLLGLFVALLWDCLGAVGGALSSRFSLLAWCALEAPRWADR
jgi:hypothetical protein